MDRRLLRFFYCDLELGVRSPWGYSQRSDWDRQLEGDVRDGITTRTCGGEQTIRPQTTGKADTLVVDPGRTDGLSCGGNYLDLF